MKLIFWTTKCKQTIKFSPLTTLSTNKFMGFLKKNFPGVQKIVKNTEQVLQIVEPQIHKKSENKYNLVIISGNT